jgi:hypothetical protein
MESVTRKILLISGILILVLWQISGGASLSQIGKFSFNLPLIFLVALFLTNYFLQGELFTIFILVGFILGLASHFNIFVYILPLVVIFILALLFKKIFLVTKSFLNIFSFNVFIFLAFNSIFLFVLFIMGFFDIQNLSSWLWGELWLKFGVEILVSALITTLVFKILPAKSKLNVQIQEK